jgi:hypothetical protein
LLKVYRCRTQGTCWVKATGTRPKIIVTGGGRGVVGHAGARLLADVAEATGLTDGQRRPAGLRQRRGVHDPGRVVVDLAVMLANGGEAICDLAVLRDQAALFGPVASDPTAWRLLSDLDNAALGRLCKARAAARELAWAQRVETRGGLPQTTADGLPVPGLVLDLDAAIVLCHSEKESATATWKKTFGYYPLFCFLDNTREALAGMLREAGPGRTHRGPRHRPRPGPGADPGRVTPPPPSRRSVNTAMGVQVLRRASTPKQPLTWAWANGSVRGSTQTNTPLAPILDLDLILA